jgi:DNA (cytosine-5)-methyltransferase 1
MDGQMRRLDSIEFCAGAGGQALGLERAGFDHKLLIDNDPHCCQTLRQNRPNWNVMLQDMERVENLPFRNIDLFAAGLPCPPFSVAGKQLGENDERNLFEDALRLVAEVSPKFVLIENVRGFLDLVFADYRASLKMCFAALGYHVDWKLFHASDFGVSQLRPRVAIVAAKTAYWPHFQFPFPHEAKAEPVGELLHDLMAANGWPGATQWARMANEIAPTIVGGSKKHGGPDLGPTRARRAWEKLGVNGSTIADAAPAADFVGLPRLTTRMVARLQGFPDDWCFSGKKTNAYRQVGNAFPPPVAEALGRAIAHAITTAEAIHNTRDDMAIAAE